MNPASYTEPKFPPTDEYSQSNYIPPHSTEYYRHSYQHNYGYNSESVSRRYIEEKYTPNHYAGCNGIPAHSGSVSPTQPSPPAPTHGTLSGGGGGGDGGGINGFNQPPAPSPSPPSVPSPDEPSSDMTQSSCAQQDADGQPVIYPWMRKSQGASGMHINNFEETVHFLSLHI